MLCSMQPGSVEHDEAMEEVYARRVDFGRLNRADASPLRPSFLAGRFTRRPLLADIDVIIAAAGVLERSTRPAEALELLDSCTTRGDSWYLQRGVVFHQLGRHAGALQSLTVVKDAASRIEADYWAGLSSLMSGRLDAAVKLLHRTARDTTDLRLRGECEYFLGHCLRLLGDEPAARAMFDRAWQAIPSDDVLDDRDDPTRTLAIPGLEAVPSNEPARREPIAAVLDDVDSLVGLATVKEQLHRLVARQAMAGETERTGDRRRRHLAFLTAPGSGTSTVARLVARVYVSLGVLSRSRVVETSGPALLADSGPRVARRVSEAVDRAVDGVLLIDDAPALLGGADDAAAAASVELTRRMHNDRDRLIVILAGSPPALESVLRRDDRLGALVGTRLRFEAYGPDDLLEIVDRLAAAQRVGVATGAREEMKALFANAQSSEIGIALGSARFAAQLFAGASDVRDVRRFRAGTGRAEVDVIELDDVRAAFELLRRELDAG
jgi:tetratricopeptide (TPR) repeat protein